jgi:hypothetical protein
MRDFKKYIGLIFILICSQTSSAQIIDLDFEHKRFAGEIEFPEGTKIRTADFDSFVDLGNIIIFQNSLVCDKDTFCRSLIANCRENICTGFLEFYISKKIRVSDLSSCSYYSAFTMQSSKYDIVLHIKPNESNEMFFVKRNQ